LLAFASLSEDAAQMGRLATVCGGARSGKSAFALRWAMRQGERRAFVATAQAFDDEMRARIALHRAERSDGFHTLEAPLELEAALRSIEGVDVVVIDCLTLWLSNLLLAGSSDAQLAERVRELLRVLSAATFASIVVSNEVGMGIVPDNALARRFRDATGRAHQALATASDELYLGAMGCVLRLHPAPLELVAR
jgi:adenosylcobinamide kinase/adenosylcobinamide-phosphate guanylyltransferase